MTESCYSEQQVLRTLNALRDQSFAPFIAHLNSLIEKALETLVSSSDPTVIARAQGRVTALREILRDVEESAINLRKLG